MEETEKEAKTEEKEKIEEGLEILEGENELEEFDELEIDIDDETEEPLENEILEGDDK